MQQEMVGAVVGQKGVACGLKGLVCQAKDLYFKLWGTMKGF